MLDVFSFMRSYPKDHPFCLIVDASLVAEIVAGIPNTEARRLLSEYKGKAHYLLIFGQLSNPSAPCDIEPIEQDSFLHVSAAVHAINVSLSAKGLSHSVWLTASEGVNLVRYMEHIRIDNQGNADTRVIH